MALKVEGHKLKTVTPDSEKKSYIGYCECGWWSETRTTQKAVKEEHVWHLDRERCRSDGSQN